MGGVMLPPRVIVMLPPRVIVMKAGSRWIARAYVCSGPRRYAVEADGDTMQAAMAALITAFDEATVTVSEAIAGREPPEVVL
jgi:hypothetical protein